MKFEDVLVCRQERYAIGTEAESGRHYVSIPVDNGLVEYEEYYEIDRGQFDRFLVDAPAALAFVEQCRVRAMDAKLLIAPGKIRGIAL
jgi:hypothetical protein